MIPSSDSAVAFTTEDRETRHSGFPWLALAYLGLVAGAIYYLVVSA